MDFVLVCCLNNLYVRLLIHCSCFFIIYHTVQKFAGCGFCVLPQICFLLKLILSLSTHGFVIFHNNIILLFQHYSTTNSRNQLFPVSHPHTACTNYSTQTCCVLGIRSGKYEFNWSDLMGSPLTFDSGIFICLLIKGRVAFGFLPYDHSIVYY